VDATVQSHIFKAYLVTQTLLQVKNIMKKALISWGKKLFLSYVKKSFWYLEWAVTA
jgi:hypothetical protein